MPRDLFATGLAWQADRLYDHASSPIRYARGPDWVATRAVLGATLLKLDAGDGGVRMEWTDADFLIRPADLVLGGVATTPERGDVIEVADADGTTRRFEVLPYGDEPPWRWSDPQRALIRVHAKLAETGGAC